MTIRNIRDICQIIIVAKLIVEILPIHLFGTGPIFFKFTFALIFEHNILNMPIINEIVPEIDF